MPTPESRRGVRGGCASTRRKPSTCPRPARRAPRQREVRYRNPMRIVSLLASGTELVCALGAGDQLVGRSHECDHPTWVTRLPALSRPTFDIAGSSDEIDRRVREKLRAGEPLYAIDEA